MVERIRNQAKVIDVPGSATHVEVLVERFEQRRLLGRPGCRAGWTYSAAGDGAGQAPRSVLATLLASDAGRPGVRPRHRPRRRGGAGDRLTGHFAAVEPTIAGGENLQMTARLFDLRRGVRPAAANELLEQLSLAEVADRRCGTYSGGQRRLDLGASLVGAPRLLLLDEPTTGLDPTGRREVWDAVRELVTGGTDVLLTTHYLDEADRARRPRRSDRPRPRDRIRHARRAQGERRA